VTQVAVNARSGLTFAAGLRAMMRADPDIIMVGEIRDRETAQISIEAALTGHLLLSTLHTNDAPSSITRLVEMGIEPFLVASSVRCVVAQRLARVLCTGCKRPIRLEADLLARSGFNASQDIEAFEAVGCPRCSGSGYRGRVGIYEIMPISDEIRDLALHSASADRIMETARAQDMRTLREDAFEKVRQGVTGVDEVLRVLGA
jgi:type IV pilus assembly protein PilB